MIPVRSYLRLLSSTLQGLGRRVGVLGAGLLVAIGLQLFNPQLLREIIDGALSGDDQGLVGLAAAFVTIAIVSQVVLVLTTWLAEDVGWRATNRLRADLTSHVLGQDLAFHTEHAPGSLIERVDGDVTALSNFFSAMTVKVLGNGLLVAGVVVLVAIESWVLGLALGVLTTGALLGFARLHAISTPWWSAVSATQAGMFGQVGEQVEGTEDIVPNGAAPFMRERFARSLRAWLPQVVRGWTGYAMMWAASQVLASGSMIAVFLLGAWLLGTGDVTVGSIFLVLYYVVTIERPLHQLREQFQDLQKAGGAIARIEDLRAITPTMPHGGDVEVAARAHELRLRGVGFTYAGEDGAPRVLRDLDLVLAPGRTLGVVGRTGSGKSTLGKLVVRLHDPTDGEVLLDGVPLADVGRLRDHVGMVTQEVQLFRATLRDNLAFFADDVDDHRLREVLGELSLGPWLDELPAGLDTVLDAGDLSAGQAQLLAFARIFLRDPGLVVLDEASSRLDPLTEASVERAVDKLLTDRTAIIIAHRLTTLDRVDDVLVLDAGEVIEQGPRDALAADPDSRFAALLATGMAEVLT